MPNEIRCIGCSAKNYSDISDSFFDHLFFTQPKWTNHNLIWSQFNPEFSMLTLSSDISNFNAIPNKNTGSFGSLMEERYGKRSLQVFGAFFRAYYAILCINYERFCQASSREEKVWRAIKLGVWNLPTVKVRELALCVHRTQKPCIARVQPLRP